MTQQEATVLVERLLAEAESVTQDYEATLIRCVLLALRFAVISGRLEALFELAGSFLESEARQLESFKS